MKKAERKSYLLEIKRMVQLMGRNSILFILGLIGGAVAPTVYNISAAYANKNIVNSAFTGNGELFLKSAIFLVCALLFNCIVDSISSYILFYSIRKAILDIRMKLFSHIIRLPKYYYDNNHTGDIISRMINDVGKIQSAYGGNLRPFVVSVVYSMSSAITMCMIDWRLFFFVVFLSLGATLIDLKFVKPMRKIANESQSRQGMLTQYIMNILAGLRINKMYDMGNIVVKRYIDENVKVAKLSMKEANKNAQVQSINYFFNMVSLVGVFLVGTYMAYKGYTDLGTVTAVIYLQGSVTMNFLQWGNNFVNIQSSLAGASRVFEVLDHDKEPQLYKYQDTDYKDNMIQLKNACFSYNDTKTVLDNFNLEVNKGQVVALVGESGGGKSTIIKILLGFYPLNSGSIVIDGKSMSEYTLQEIRQKIAYVPQDAYLFDGTIEENIRYGNPKASLDEVIEAAKTANAHNFIIQMADGYNTRVGERGTKLSGGQRQRVAIARAIIKNASILLLDDATSSLDTESEQLVQNALNKLMEGRTSIVIAHRLSTIEKSDIINVVKDGKIIEKGSHNELLRNKSFYNKLYQLQFKKQDESIGA